MNWLEEHERTETWTETWQRTPNIDIQAWARIQLPLAKGQFLEQCARQTGTMYGMLLESVQHYVIYLHGNEAWSRIVHAANVHNMVFTTHGRYSDVIILRLASACSDVMRDRTREEYMCFFGQCFVEYCSHYGYDRIMRVSGRHYRDFLQGIDNLHETMRFSYPKMVNPSFYVQQEDVHGCVLHYRSKRVGFTHYVIGQLTQFATNYYNVRVDIDVLKERIHDKGCHVIFRLNFDNQAFCLRRQDHVTTGLNPFPPVEQTTFFKVFPFALVFDESLRITHTGRSLRLLFKQSLVGLKVTDHFLLRRPLMDFTYDNVQCHQSVMFELETSRPVGKAFQRHADVGLRHDEMAAMSRVYDDDTNAVLLKGQMRHVPDLHGMAFLCTPLLGNIDDLETLRLKLNDLSMYDSSRDMVLRGWQHASAIEYTIEQQVKKSQQIAENMAQLDAWKNRSDQLLYAMIPRSIAERLKNGDDPINTCQMFDSVTIIFSYLVGFTEICTHLPALQCIELINGIFSMFDSVVDEYNIFKVETLGDAVYMAAGGVPDPTDDHAVQVAGVALTLRHKIHSYNLLPDNSNTFNIRIGMHTGSVVAGVVGKRTPQYCLFGDTVNTASRMQTYSQPGAIHISEPCKARLDGHGFICHLRGTMDIKGKGGMSTYWLIGREGEEPTQAPPTSDEYTEFEKTADSPIRNEPSRLIKEGFCIEPTTVKCRSKQKEDEVELGEEDIVHNHRELHDVRPFPKVCVEDFKSFLASRSGKRRPEKGLPLTCPFSGLKLDPCCFFTDSNDCEPPPPDEGQLQAAGGATSGTGGQSEEQKDEEIAEGGGPGGEEQEEIKCAEKGGREEETRTTGEEEEEVVWWVGGGVEEAEGGKEGRRERKPHSLYSGGSPNSFTFLDQVRHSIDGAASKLNQSIRTFHQQLRADCRLRNVGGLTLSQSVDCLNWDRNRHHQISTSHSLGMLRSDMARSRSYSIDLLHPLRQRRPTPLQARRPASWRKLSDPLCAPLCQCQACERTDNVVTSSQNGYHDYEARREAMTSPPREPKHDNHHGRNEKTRGTLNGPFHAGERALTSDVREERPMNVSHEDVFDIEDLSQ